MINPHSNDVSEQGTAAQVIQTPMQAVPFLFGRELKQGAFIVQLF